MLTKKVNKHLFFCFSLQRTCDNYSRLLHSAAENMSRLENSRDAVRASLKSSVQEWLSHWQQVSNYIIIYAVALECDMIWIIRFAK